MGWDLKFNALVEAIHDFDVHAVRSEPEALLLESKLIKEFKPRYNISFRDDKRFLMLKVNLNDPIPNFTFTRLKKDDGARYFGPFVNSAGAAQHAHARAHGNSTCAAAARSRPARRITSIAFTRI